jgi:hypothetical protein
MARYNTVLSSNTTVVTGGSTIVTPNAGSFTIITGSSGTVTIPNPTQFFGMIMSFYNATAGAVTLSIPSAAASSIFQGPGSSGTSTQNLPTLTTISLASDGSHYYIISEEGGPLVATSATLGVTSGITFTSSSTDDSTTNATGAATFAGGVAVNKNITIGKSGTNTGLLRIEGQTSGTFVQKAAATTTGYTITWPSSVSSGTNYSLVSDTSGNLSWIQAGPIVTQTTTAGTYYPIFTSTADASIMTDARIQNTGLSFNPNTNNLVINGTVNSYRTDTTNVTSSYTLALTDRDKVVSVLNSAAVTITIPAEASVAFPVGTVVYVLKQAGATSTVTLAAAGGVSVNKTGALATGEEIILRKRASDTWVVFDQYYPAIQSPATFTTSGAYTVVTFTSGNVMSVG